MQGEHFPTSSRFDLSKAWSVEEFGATSSCPAYGFEGMTSGTGAKLRQSSLARPFHRKASVQYPRDLTGSPRDPGGLLGRSPT